MNPFRITVSIIMLMGALNFSIAQKPIDNNDGFCYAKLKTPDKYDEISEEVLVRPESTVSKKIPAEFTTIYDSILVQPESKRMVYVPAVYNTVEQQMLDRPESIKIITVPAVTETRMENVMIKEESKKLVIVPAVYETVTEKILIQPELKKFVSLPAVYETVTEKVLAKAASMKYIPIPTEYETIYEDVEIEPATTKMETIPPTFKTVEEKVLVKPSYTKWEKSKSDKNCLSANPDDCIVWCLVEIPNEYKIVKKTINVGCDGSGVANSGCVKEIEVPARYEKKAKRVIKTPASTREEMIPEVYTTVTKSVIKTPATVKEEIIPAKYKTYTKRIIKTPATTREEIIPAEYQNISTQVIITPATTREELIPAKYKMVNKTVIVTSATTREEIIPAIYNVVSKRVLVQPERIETTTIPATYNTIVRKELREKGDMQWKRIVCNRHQTPELNLQLQDALKAAGYNPGPSDNLFGPRTYAALIQYQKDNGLWQGHLDYATVAALGLELLPDAYQNIDGTMLSNNSSNGADNDILTSKGGSDLSGQSGRGLPSGNGNLDTSNSSSNDSKSKNSTSNNTATSMTSDEQRMIDEINLMRSNPKSYVKYVKEYINQVKNDEGLDAAYKADEVSSANELIDELNKLGPLSILKPHEGLHQVGNKHGKDVQGQGMIGHRGSDGTMPWDRVKRDTDLKDGNENLVAGGGSVRESLMILLVDSGIPGRGHRVTLLEPKWTHVGVDKIGDVGGIPNAWIQVFGEEK